MEKFIPYAKLSKKKRRELDAQKRGTWAINPVVRKPASPKAYNRNKAQKRRKELSVSVPCFAAGSSENPNKVSMKTRFGFFKYCIAN